MTQVTLSRRNLLSLLHKLEMDGSACSIVKPGGIFVVAESDDVHYEGREPGPMHPETEQFVTDMDEVLRIIRSQNEVEEATRRNCRGPDNPCDGCVCDINADCFPDDIPDIDLDGFPLDEDPEFPPEFPPAT